MPQVIAVLLWVGDGDTRLLEAQLARPAFYAVGQLLEVVVGEWLGQCESNVSLSVYRLFRQADQSRLAPNKADSSCLLYRSMR